MLLHNRTCQPQVSRAFRIHRVFSVSQLPALAMRPRSVIILHRPAGECRAAFSDGVCNGGVPKWPKGTDCKSVIRGFESHRRLCFFDIGSLPPLRCAASRQRFMLPASRERAGSGSAVSRATIRESSLPPTVCHRHRMRRPGPALPRSAAHQTEPVSNHPVAVRSLPAREHAYGES